MFSTRPGGAGRSWLRVWRSRKLLLALAALPLFQTTGCFPDVVGATSFELQLLINGTLINAVNTVVRNIFGL
jgi:hypothetical protein